MSCAVRAPQSPRPGNSWLRAAVAMLLLGGVASGCASPLPVATAGDAARAGFEVGELERGRSLVAAKCSGCHRTPRPAEHRTDEWPRMLDEMAARSHLDGGQRRAIEQYLVTMARR